MPIAVQRMRFVILAAMLIVLWSADVANAAINRQVNFQGRLTNAGVTVPDGTYNMELKIHNDATAPGDAQGLCTGSCLWVETRTGAARVTVTRGLFAVQLGEVASLAAVNFDQSSLYVSVRVGGTALTPSWDTEMTPRQRLGAAPQAIQASVAGDVSCTDCVTASDLAVDSVTASELAPDAVTSVDILNGTVGIADLAFDPATQVELDALGVAGTINTATNPVAWTKLKGVPSGIADGVDDGVPSGTVMPFLGSTAPSGWLLCNGGAGNRTTHAGLFAVIGTGYGAGDGSTTFGLPNCSGRAPVARDAGQVEFDGLGEQGGAKTHTLSAAEMPSHSHMTVGYYGGAAGGTVTNDVLQAVPGGSMNWYGGYTQATGGSAAHNNLQPYMVFNFIIKG